MRPKLGALALVLALLLTPALLAGPQATPEEAPNQPASAPEANAKDVAASSVIEYSPGTYRDPFRSLREPQREQERPRPPGPAGMLIEEIDVVGMLAGPRGSMVLIVGTDGLGYALTSGSKLYDGVTLRIDEQEGLVVFRQDVNDPNRIKPYRDIVRTLDSGS